jgi:hypothetical protein
MMIGADVDTPELEIPQFLHPIFVHQPVEGAVELRALGCLARYDGNGDSFDVRAISENCWKCRSTQIARSMESNGRKPRAGLDELLYAKVGDIDRLSALGITSNEDAQCTAECRFRFCNDIDD